MLSNGNVPITQKENAMGATIIDIAEKANTSKSTVSRYLNGGSVKPATAKAIEDAIQLLDFRPNVNARRLVTNRTHVIGIVLDDISNPYWSDVLSGLQTVAARNGYVCTFYSRLPAMKEEPDYLDLFREGHVDGLIMGTFLNRDASQVEQLASSGYPIVLMGDNAENRSIDYVDVDNRQGTMEEVRHLFSLGHRRIAYLQGPSHMSGTRRRLEGYLEGMQDLGLATGPVIDTEWTVPGGYSATRKLLEMKVEEPFTAIICSNEYCAFGAISALRESGLSVPEDISVTAFDDGTLAMFTTPSITTVRQPFRMLGEMALKQLMETLSDAPRPRTCILLHPQLKERTSSGRCSPIE